MASTQVLLTSTVLAEWTAKKDELEALLKRTQEELNRVTQMIQAGAFLLDSGAKESVSAATSQPTPPPAELFPSMANGHDQEAESTGLTAAIEEIANSAPGPLAKPAVKKLLRAKGFGEDRLGSYFYTAIARLKGRHRITVLKDGALWKAPAK